MSDVGENLLRYHKTQKYFIIDAETCHLNLLSNYTNYPWQWAYGIYTLEQGLIEQKNIYVKWPHKDFHVGKEAARITRFDPRVIKERGITPEQALQYIDKYFYDPDFIPVMHNGMGFDIHIHNLHRRKLGLKTDYSYFNRMIDTVALGRAYNMNISSVKRTEQLRFAMLKKRGLRTSLGAMCKKFDIDYDTKLAHDALYDIEKNWDILKALLWKVEID